MNRFAASSFLAIAALLLAQGVHAQTPRPATQRPSAAAQPPVTEAMIRSWKRTIGTSGFDSHAWNRLPPDRAVAELKPFLVDIDANIRNDAARALGALRAKPRSGAMALAMALDSVKNVDSKVQFAEALERYGPAAAPSVPALIRALVPAAREGSADVIVAALTAIGPAAASAAEPLLRVMEDTALMNLVDEWGRPHPLVTGDYFVQMGSTISPLAPRLVRLWADNRLQTRWRDSNVPQAIGRLGAPAFDATVAELRRGETYRQARLLSVLGYTKNPAAVPILLGIVAMPRRDARFESGSETKDIRDYAFTALGLLGAAGAAALPELSRLTESEDRVMSQGARRAINGIRTSQVQNQ